MFSFCLLALLVNKTNMSSQPFVISYLISLDLRFLITPLFFKSEDGQDDCFSWVSLTCVIIA